MEPVEEKKAVKLSVPEDVTCVDATENTLTISWSAVPNASGYMVLCKDVLSKSWSDCESAMTSDKDTETTIENLYPTATFEVKVVAVSNSKDYLDSDESEVIYCDTSVGSCAPKDKKCFGFC